MNNKSNVCRLRYVLPVIMAIVISATPSTALSALENSPVTKIAELYGYGEYGNGDVLVKLETNGTTCSNGYWMNKSDIGYETLLSMILAAYHADKTIGFQGENSDMWPGSSGSFCRIKRVDYGT